MFKAFRIFVLSLILIGVAITTWQTQVKSVAWEKPLVVNVYPINADGSTASAAYIRRLAADNFAPISTFMQEEAARRSLSKKVAIEVRLGAEITALPPAPPQNGSTLSVMMWSLHMRWWAYRHAKTTGPGPQVKLFLVYFDPTKTAALGHSTALQKGLIGRVNVFAAANMADQNNVVITHEFLHTLGATDKYNFETNQPIFPAGYAEPERNPLLPQHYAEIMAGRTPTSLTEAHTPDHLDKVLIGDKTAQEINWLPAND